MGAGKGRAGVGGQDEGDEKEKWMHMRYDTAAV